MGGLDDQRLVRAARSGDGGAFALLVNHHYPALLASCERMLADVDLARDAAQEATLRAMLGLDHLRDDTRFGAWLVGIGLNVCRGLLGVGRRQVSLDALRDGGRLVEPTADTVEPVELIAADELGIRVREAIAALPVGQRQAVALSYIDGLTRVEAAEEIGTRPGAIKTRLHTNPSRGRPHRLLGGRSGTAASDLDRTDDARVIADEAKARHAASMAANQANPRD